MSETPKIAPYDGPAGGWPALKAVTAHLLQQDIHSWRSLRALAAESSAPPRVASRGRGTESA